MTAPETIARQSLISLLETEFAPEAIPVKDDKIHRSLGNEGPVIGVSPVRSGPSGRDYHVLQAEVLVQFYGRYTLEVDVKQTVSPATIEDYAERFRNAVRTSGDPNNNSVWFFNVERIEFPDDPTGNKTRFEAYLTAKGNNPALTETTG